MSGFIATSPAGTPKTLTNDGFFPDIDLTHLRASMRLDGSVTTERLEAAAIAAILSVNADLAPLKNDTATLAELPSPQINGQPANLHLYRRAVYSLAAAELHERYRNYDATNSGAAAADELSPSIDELKRDARFAIRDLLKQVRITVELI